MIGHLIKKDLRKVWLLTLTFLVFCILMCALLFNSDDMKEIEYANTQAINLAGLLLNMLVFGNLMSVEKYEEKHNAYKMMAPLPVSAREVVAGKFVIVFLSVVFGITGIAVIYDLFGIGDLFPVLRIRYFLFTGSISLVLNGLCYVGVFRYGYHKMRAPIMGVYILVLLGPQLAGEKDSYQLAILRAGIPAVAGWIAAALCLYVACIYVSVRVKESREI